jgi:hypothetical protein
MLSRRIGIPLLLLGYLALPANSQQEKAPANVASSQTPTPVKAPPFSDAIRKTVVFLRVNFKAGWNLMGQQRDGLLCLLPRRPNWKRSGVPLPGHQSAHGDPRG